MIAPTWSRLSRIGPWLRGERYKRYYGGEFSNNGYISGFARWWLLVFHRGAIETFSGMKGFFEPIIGCQDIVRAELLRIVKPGILERVEQIASEGSFVGVHIRRGDFTGTHMVTSDDWYVKALHRALDTKLASERTCVRVFSDEYPEKLSFLKAAFPCEKIIIMPKAPAIQDILLLSRASILVCSSRSTFSMWGVYLNQVPSVWRDGDGFVRPPRLYDKEARIIYV